MFFVSLLKPGPSSFMLLYERIWAYTPISESSSGSRGHNKYVCKATASAGTTSPSLVPYLLPCSISIKPKTCPKLLPTINAPCAPMRQQHGDTSCKRLSSLGKSTQDLHVCMACLAFESSRLTLQFRQLSHMSRQSPWSSLHSDHNSNQTSRQAIPSLLKF